MLCCGCGAEPRHRLASARADDVPITMANPIVKAFNLALAGDAAGLRGMLEAKEVDASAARPDGMYKSWTLLHAAASKNHVAAADVLLAAGADLGAKNVLSTGTLYF